VYDEIDKELGCKGFRIIDIYDSLGDENTVDISIRLDEATRKAINIFNLRRGIRYKYSKVLLSGLFKCYNHVKDYKMSKLLEYITNLDLVVSSYVDMIDFVQVKSRDIWFGNYVGTKSMRIDSRIYEIVDKLAIELDLQFSTLVRILIICGIAYYDEFADYVGHPVKNKIGKGWKVFADSKLDMLVKEVERRYNMYNRMLRQKFEAYGHLLKNVDEQMYEEIKKYIGGVAGGN